MFAQEAMLEILLCELPDLAAVYLFGSHASEEAGPESDVDLGLLLPRPDAHRLAGLARFQLQEKLATVCGCDVDVINLRTAPTVLAREIVTTGQVLVCGDEYARQEFEMLTLSFYQKLNDERREILRAGLVGERFYGT